MKGLELYAPREPYHRRTWTLAAIVLAHGEPLTKSGLDSAWQRFIRLAIEKEVITADQRFGLHDLKRKGGTDTPGTFAEKQQALGLTEQMMKFYDKSVPEVAPSA